VFVVPWKFPVKVSMRGNVITKVEFLKGKEKTIARRPKSGVAAALYDNMLAYFSGERISFNRYEVELRSAFLRRVLGEVRKIGYGETTTYGELAKKLETSPRAVGQALKANPAPVVIPCHRVLAKRGLGGFSQGLDVKRELLRIEGIDLIT